MPSSATTFLNVFLFLLVLVPVLLAFAVKAEIEKIDRALDELETERGDPETAPAPASASVGDVDDSPPPAAEAESRPDAAPEEAAIEPEQPKTRGPLQTESIGKVAFNASLTWVIRVLLRARTRRSRKRDKDISSES